MKADDFFESAREAAAELERIERRIDSMRSNLSGGGSGVASTGGQRGDAHGMGKVDAAVDYEARMRPLLEQDRRILDRACRVLYGDGNGGGVARGIGNRYAEAVWHRALDAKTWKEVAAACDASTATVRRWYDVSMNYIDAVGFDGAIAGEEV